MRVDRETYENLVQAFSALPGQARAAARAVGVDPRTARRGWSTGWPDRGLEPIRDRVEREQRAARAALVRDAEDTREARRTAAHELEVDAQLDRAKHRAEEARMVRASRANALALANTIAGLHKDAMPLVERLRNKLREHDTSVEDGLAVTRQLAQLTRESNEASRLAVQLERLVLGEPESIVGHVVADMSPADAEREVAEAARAVERVRRRGALDVPARESSNSDGSATPDHGAGEGGSANRETSISAS